MPDQDAMPIQQFEPVFHILHDQPEANDAFGPHGSIATTLANLIKSPQPVSEEGQNDGYFIALEGKWGSGKSSIIQMLKGQLDQETSPVIIFDAWAHSGDHLRRVFLEVLIQQLQ
ncbi:MAG: hypothetical protein JKY27_00355, partial [Magnetovibrio sp.]|nr:hypothetical protein [Magnetovibrio sp.]